MCSNCGRFGELPSLRIVDSLRETSLGGWHVESLRDPMGFLPQPGKAKLSVQTVMYGPLTSGVKKWNSMGMI